MLCHDNDVKGIFGENIFYVTVSRTASLKSIVQKILAQYLKVKHYEMQTDEEEKNQLENVLRQMGSERILLVLDDVWSESESIIQDLMFPIPGYKILVTSRSLFPKFGSTYELTLLNDEDAKTLFCYSAFPYDGIAVNVPDDLVTKDQYQWRPSENAAVYRAWEQVMSSRFSNILSDCRREAALRATEDNVEVGNDLALLKPYTPTWIDQAHWDDMIDRVWNTEKWKKKSAIARQNRLSEADGQISKHTAGSITILQHKFKMEKQKGRPVSLLEAYDYTHTQETTEALGSGTDDGSGDGTGEAVGSGTREYITRRSKRVADAVMAAFEDEHGPDASQHPPNDFDLWVKATGGKKKGKLVGLGTRRDPRLMVTSSSSSSSHAHHTGSQPSEQVQKLEEMIKQLQEDNAQMRARSEIEMQVQVQRQVENQLQEHMRQRELEFNAREEAREREWQRNMEDINLMLNKFNDPRPPQ